MRRHSACCYVTFNDLFSLSGTTGARCKLSRRANWSLWTLRRIKHTRFSDLVVTHENKSPHWMNGNTHPFLTLCHLRLGKDPDNALCSGFTCITDRLMALAELLLYSLCRKALGPCARLVATLPIHFVLKEAEVRSARSHTERPGYVRCPAVPVICEGTQSFPKFSPYTRFRLTIHLEDAAQFCVN